MVNKEKVVLTFPVGKSERLFRDTTIMFGGNPLYARFSFPYTNILRLEFTPNQFVILAHPFVGIEFLEKIAVIMPSVGNAEFFEPMQTRIFYRGVEMRYRAMELLLSVDKNSLSLDIPESCFEIIVEKSVNKE